MDFRFYQTITFTQIKTIKWGICIRVYFQENKAEFNRIIEDDQDFLNPLYVLVVSNQVLIRLAIKGMRDTMFMTFKKIILFQFWFKVRFILIYKPYVYVNIIYYQNNFIMLNKVILIKSICLGESPQQLIIHVGTYKTSVNSKL